MNIARIAFRVRLCRNLLLGAALSFAAAVVYGAGLESEASADTRLLEYLEGAYLRLLAANPSLATDQGLREGTDRWESIGESGARAEAAAATEELTRVRREFATAPLGPKARLQYRVFEGSQELLLERYRWRNHIFPLNQIVGPPIDIPQVLATQRVESVEDAEAWLRRVSATPAYLGGLVERLELQAQGGVFLPRSVYPILIGQARGIRDGIPTRDEPGAAWQSAMLDDFRGEVAARPVTAAGQEALVARAKSALVRDLRPAYDRVIATLEAHAARTPITGGVWQLPEGDAFYAFLVRQYTTTDMTPAQVHEMGLREVERTHREMAAITRQVGFEGDLRAFMQKMKADQRFYLSNDEAGRAAYLARARGIVEAMRAPAPCIPRAACTAALDRAHAGLPGGGRAIGLLHVRHGRRQPARARVAQPEPPRRKPALRSREPALPRGDPGASPADLEHPGRSDDPAAAQGRALLGELGLRRGLGALRRAARQGDGILPGSLLGFRPARRGTLAGDAPRRRLRAALQALDA